jgi:signal transduction histidine kinase
MREVAHFGREFSENADLGRNRAFVSVLRTTWKLIAFAPEHEVFSQIRQINRVALLFFVAVIFIIGISSLVVSNAVVSPIRRLTAGVHRLSAGNYRRHIEVSSDDELRELADAFNRLADRLADRRRDDQFLFLGHFAARMAHEMRKPLHIAQLAAQALKSRQSYSAKHVEMIEREIENADRFISEILNFGRPHQLDLTEYSLAELTEKVLADHELVIEKEGIALSTDIDHAVPPMYLDILRMEQVISNLLQNAVEAATEDGGEPWIVVRVASRDDGAVVLEITDGGPGFDEETQERAMDPYFTSKDSGTGLGLSISYRILTAHDATLTLENTERGNGRVRVRFSL